MATVATLEDVFKEFHDQLSPKDRLSFNSTTLQDLQNTISNLQSKQKSKRTLQNMRRLEGFLEAMKIYMSILDLFVNVNNMVAFVWGPVKYLLLVTQNFSEAFNALLDAYERIGENIPLLDQYQATFGEDVRMQKALKAIIKDIFEFHLHAWKYFNKSVLKHVFHATWNNFNTKFKGLLDNMGHHKGLVERQASLIEFEEASKQRQFDRQAIDKAEKDELLRKKQYLQTWLSAVDWKSDHADIAAAREWNPNAGLWLFTHREIKNWTDPNAAPSPLLWVNGIPGSGKSVLASCVIDKLRASPAGVLYFYFHHADSLRDTFVSMARAFLQQLLLQDDVHIEHLYEEATKSGESQLRGQQLAAQLLDIRLKERGAAWIVIDGLDECKPSEQRYIVGWIRKLVNDSVSINPPFRCAFFAQDDATTRTLLAREPTLQVGAASHLNELAAYCAFRANDVRLRFGLTEEEKSELSAKTAFRADGMFLFAKLVMRNLLCQTNRASLRVEMEDEFPVGLEAAYARILHRILGKKAPEPAPGPYQQDAKRILAWMVCATRPLKWREIQAALSIDLENETVDVQGRGQVAGAKELCGSLIEERNNGDVVLVHPTARLYLEQADHEHYIPTLDEHLKLTTLCLDYFNLPLFLDTDETHTLDKYVLQGAFGFLEYALVNWRLHLERALATRPLCAETMTPLLRSFEETLDTFIENHWIKPAKKLRATKQMSFTAEVLQDEALHEPLVGLLACMHHLLSFNLPDKELVAGIKILSVLPTIRARIEKLADDPTRRPRLACLYGDNLYRCSRLYCTRFHEGFTDAQEREAHVAKHDRPFYCPHAECLYATLGCITKQELDKHITDCHKLPTEDDFPDLTRSNKAAKHGEKGPREHVCQVCQRAFSKPSNLRTHEATHSNNRPHACKSCDKRFTREIDLTRHENTHGERKFTCRGADCGKSFARPDALRRHWSSATGQKCPFTFPPEDDVDETSLSMEKRIQKELAKQRLDNNMQKDAAETALVTSSRHSPASVDFPDDISTTLGGDGSGKDTPSQILNGIDTSTTTSNKTALELPGVSCILSQWKPSDSRSTTLDGYDGSERGRSPKRSDALPTSDTDVHQSKRRRITKARRRLSPTGEVFNPLEPIVSALGPRSPFAKPLQDRSSSTPAGIGKHSLP